MHATRPQHVMKCISVILSSCDVSKTCAVLRCAQTASESHQLALQLVEQHDLRRHTRPSSTSGFQLDQFHQAAASQPHLLQLPPVVAMAPVDLQGAGFNRLKDSAGQQHLPLVQRVLARWTPPHVLTQQRGLHWR